jgi:hypothetical protein
MPAINQLPTPFDGYEICGVREFGTGPDLYFEPATDRDSQYWSLYGNIPGSGLAWIGDFCTRDAAEELYARITGRLYSTCNLNPKEN